MSAAALRPGIDMIMLHAKPGDYQIKDQSNLGHRMNTEPGQTLSDLPYLYRDLQGYEVHANGSKYKGVSANLPYTVEIDQRGLAFQWNPSKIKNGSNSFLLVDDVKDIAKIGDLLKADLDHAGIYVDMDSMCLSRLDITKQDFTGRPLIEYHSALSQICGDSRKDKRAYDDSYYIQQGQRTLKLYDKGKQLKNAALNDFIRAETVFLSSKTISKALQISSYSQFLKTDQDHWNHHYNALFNQFVPSDPSGRVITYESIVEFFKSIKKTNGRNYFNEFWKRKGLEFFLEFGCIDLVWRAAKEAGIKGPSIYEEKKRVEKMKNELIKEARLSDKITAAELIHELKQKFAA